MALAQVALARVALAWVALAGVGRWRWPERGGGAGPGGAGRSGEVGVSHGRDGQWALQPAGQTSELSPFTFPVRLF